MHYSLNHRDKNHKCNQCGKAFSLNCKLQYHMKKCKGKQENISRLGSTQKSKINSKQKFKINQTSYQVLEFEDGKNIKCNQCDARFNQKWVFASHYYRIHKEKTLKCDKCEKLFSHSLFLKTHIDKCEGCLCCTVCVPKPANLSTLNIVLW